MSDADGRAVVEITQITDVHLYIDCPYCGDEHRHGNARELDVGDTTHRVSHCGEVNGGYYLKRTEQTERLEVRR
jgi:uncharacterized Zn finger protein